MGKRQVFKSVLNRWFPGQQCQIKRCTWHRLRRRHGLIQIVRKKRYNNKK
jgi:hypothetical protein